MKRIIVDFTRRLFGVHLIYEKLCTINEKSNTIDENLNKLSIAMQTLVNAQRFISAIGNCEWLRYKSFIPGGWAMDNVALYTLFRIITHMKPKNVLEFGLGQSSLMIHQYAAFYENVQALTIEHDSEWISFFCNGIPEYIKMSIKQVDVECIEYSGFETLTYKNVETLKDGCWYDFFIVDGPFGSDHYSRSQIIEMVNENLPERFCILIDDSNRIGEEETIKELCKILTNQKREYHIINYHGEKTMHTVICSSDLKFLTSL